MSTLQPPTPRDSGSRCRRRSAAGKGSPTALSASGSGKGEVCRAGAAPPTGAGASAGEREPVAGRGRCARGGRGAGSAERAALASEKQALRGTGSPRSASPSRPTDKRVSPSSRSQATRSPPPRAWEGCGGSPRAAGWGAVLRAALSAPPRSPAALGWPCTEQGLVAPAPGLRA